MMDLGILTGQTERRARDMAQAAGSARVLAIIRRGTERIGRAAVNAIRPLTPKDKGYTRDSLRMVVRGVGGSEVRAGLLAVPVPGRPAFLFQLLNDGSRPHIIRARNRRVLRFETARGVVFAREVRHPGTRAYRQVERGLAASQATRARYARDMAREVARAVGAVR